MMAMMDMDWMGNNHKVIMEIDDNPNPKWVTRSETITDKIIIIIAIKIKERKQDHE